MQQPYRKRPVHYGSMGGGNGQGLWRLQMVRVPGWQTVGGGFFCTPNKLRMFFFTEIPWKKMGTGRVAGRRSPCGEGFLSWGPRMSFQWGWVLKPLELSTHILCLCMFFGTKGLSLLSAPQRSPWPKHVKNHRCKDQIHLQTLQNEPIFHLILEEKIQPQLFSLTTHVSHTWCHF